MFAIRQGRWKLIEGLGDGGCRGFAIRLYDCPGLPVIDEETGEVQDMTFKPTAFPKPEPGEPPGQLYDLETDPGETTNLWLQHPELVRSLQELLDDYRSSGRSRPLAR
jgi:hypothetical protein